MDRWVRKYKKMGNFQIEPWDSRYYALFDGDELVCVTAYKKGAIEVMKRLTKARKCKSCRFKIHQDNGGKLCKIKA